MFFPRTLEFRRHVFIAGLAVGVILLIAFYWIFANSVKAEKMNRLVAHSQEVLGVIARVRLEPASLQNQVWAYRASRDEELARQFPTHLNSFAEDLATLRGLTADNSVQRNLLAELLPILANQITSLKQAMGRAVAAPDQEIDLASDWSLPTPLSEHVQRLFDSLEANERVLLQQRQAAVNSSARRTTMILFGAGIGTFGVLIFLAALFSREVETRVELQTGIGLARELLGKSSDEQQQELQHELSDAIADLHHQIRKRQQAETELHRLNVELEERVRLRTQELVETNRELETFNYAVSHDLRAPLRHIEGFSQVLEQKYCGALSGEARHYLQRIHSAVRHMSKLVEGLLQLSRVGQKTPRLLEVSLSGVVDAAREKLAPEMKGREIEWRIGALPMVHGDAVLLEQAMINLLANAIKFTRLQAHALIEVGIQKREGETAVFVRDNGTGFDDRYAGKLFGVFQRLHREEEFEGTGIGLATVQRIIHRHGGRIWGESVIGHGATFFFTLPIAERPGTEQLQMMGASA